MAYRFKEEVLRHFLKKLTRKQKLYRVLKDELSAHGWWKNKTRGRHKKGVKGQGQRWQRQAMKKS